MSFSFQKFSKFKYPNLIFFRPHSIFLSCQKILNKREVMSKSMQRRALPSWIFHTMENFEKLKYFLCMNMFLKYHICLQKSADLVLTSHYLKIFFFFEPWRYTYTYVGRVNDDSVPTFMIILWENKTDNILLSTSKYLCIKFY